MKSGVFWPPNLRRKMIQMHNKTRLVKCPECGWKQLSQAKTKVRCVRCEKGYSLHSKKKGTMNVLLPDVPDKASIIQSD